jgi:hypothetical protein
MPGRLTNHGVGNLNERLMRALTVRYPEAFANDPPGAPTIARHTLWESQRRTLGKLYQVKVHGYGRFV